MNKYLFRHNLGSITLTIMADSLIGAEEILKLIVKDTKHWENYN